MNAIVQATGLTKTFGKFKAVDEISFTIEKGSIVGLIGPNGAGKTTTLKSILGLTDFSGELSVLGMDPRSGRHHLMERVCFISDVGILPRWIRASEALDYIEAVHPRFDRSKALALLAKTNVPLNKKVKQLSKGMVTQLHLSLMLAIDVDLLVLDEPTLGLDILYRKAFYDHLLNDYLDKDTSIIISTHQVEEIQSLLSHLIFIDEGKIILDKPMDNLEKHYAEVQIEPSQLEAAVRLQPIHTKEVFGRQVMIFEEAEPAALESLGEVRVPSVVDLFVAKMHKEDVRDGQ